MSAKQRILLVEDEVDLAELVRFNVEREGYDCRCVHNGTEALAEVRRARPDLIILDRMLPGQSGDDVAAKLKRDGDCAAIPVIMLTAKAEESDQLVGFALGVDDYLTKPFSMKVLLARIAAVLRRSGFGESAGAVTIGPVSLDESRHEVRANGIPVALTTMEFRILKTLMVANGRVLDREQLIDAVLGPTVAITDRTIDVHIAAVRKKLGGAASWVQTIRGIGYAFREPS